MGTHRGTARAVCAHGQPAGSNQGEGYGMETIKDSGELRQIVFHYVPRETGSCDFAVWHFGKRHVTIYGPEGNTLRTVDIDRATITDATQAAQSYGPVDVRHFSPSLYPREG